MNDTFAFNLHFFCTETLDYLPDTGRIQRSVHTGYDADRGVIRYVAI